MPDVKEAVQFFSKARNETTIKTNVMLRDSIPDKSDSRAPSRQADSLRFSVSRADGGAVAKRQGIVGPPLRETGGIYQPKIALDLQEMPKVESGPTVPEIEWFEPPSRGRANSDRSLGSVSIRSRLRGSLDTLFETEETMEVEHARMLPAGTFIYRPLNYEVSLGNELLAPALTTESLQTDATNQQPRQAPSRRWSALEALLPWKNRPKKASTLELDRTREESFYSTEEHETRPVSQLAAKLGKGEVKKTITMKFQNAPDTAYIRSATARRLSKIKQAPGQGRTIHQPLDRTPLHRDVGPVQFDANQQFQKES
eukprot:Gregarina_sp_Poly_1__9707@NODE_616_length_7127_cov_52_867989_g472_i0_p4_GENE_NODE_616_length_7127_cov_52_867989_g472_i0NODE_616_length_7127_cov_52_867989_g472_i0_p4_ORF_typecomplete_len313_score33_66_NODE_616_length_7127_cov_52_867989_g472_i042055143